MTYNGYPSQDAFHAALQAGSAEYARKREEGMRTNPQGWAHADCDHAYGICTATPAAPPVAFALPEVVTPCTETYAHLEDPAERDWLISVDPADVVTNAHRIYEFMRDGGLPADSYTRELAFNKAVDMLGIEYGVLCDAFETRRAVTVR